MQNFGFVKSDKGYCFAQKIFDDQFELQVVVQAERAYSKLYDLSSGEEYILADIEDATGKFVGSVRESYQHAIENLIESCTDDDIFKFSQTKQIIEYVEKKYVDKLEFLWKKFPNDAVFRCKDTKKWYVAILTTSKKNFGFDSNSSIEVIDLRNVPNDKIVDNQKIFKGYHMNKKNWISIVLDDSVETQKIEKLIDNSHKLAEIHWNLPFFLVFGNFEQDIAHFWKLEI